MAIDNSGVSKVPLSGEKSLNNVPRKIGTHTNYSTPNYNSSLQEGQILRGEITDLRNKEVTITLSDNTTVIGRTTDNTSLYIGQTAAFKVVSITGQSIVLENISGKWSGGMEATILDALEEADIPKTERNMQMVKDLLMHQMPINKQMLQQMIKQTASFPDASSDTLVAMNKYNLDINAQTASLFENFKSGKGSMLSTIDSVSETLPSLLSTLADSAPPSLVREFGASLLNITASHIDNTESMVYNPDLSFLSAEEKAVLIDSLSETNPSLADNIIRNEASIHDVLSIFKNIDAGDNSTLSSIINKLEYADSYLAYKNNSLGHVMDVNMRGELAALLEESGMPESFIADIKQGFIPADKVFSAISSHINSMPDSMSDTASKLFRSEVFETLFKETNKHIWTLSPDQLSKNPDAVKDYYAGLLNDINMATKLIESNLSGQGSQSITEQTNAVKNAVLLTEQINNFMSFVELPVKFMDQTAHGNLYVYTKKEELRRHPDKVSVLLHLDMDNLGPLDIHIEKKNNSISSTFYCTDEQNAALFRQNISLLEDALNEKGYLFSASITNKSKTTDVVKDFIENKPSVNTDNGNKKSPVSRYKFDIRA